MTTPFKGVVTKRYADTGSLIQVGTQSNTRAMPVVRIAHSGLLRLRMPVLEADVPFIKTGGDAQVYAQTTDRTFSGKIIRFTRSMDSSTRTMVVEVDVPNADLSLSPGMLAEVVLTLERRNDVATIPSQAVTERNQPHVLVKVGTESGAAGSSRVGQDGNPQRGFAWRQGYRLGAGERLSSCWRFHAGCREFSSSC